MAAANFLDWKREQTVFSDLQLMGYAWLRLGAEQLQAARVGTGLFDLLGVSAALGRTFRVEDEGQKVLLLSDAVWRHKFGGDPNVVGRTIQVGDSGQYTILGVLRRDFFFYLNDFELWIPLSLSQEETTDRNLRNLFAVGRLKETVSTDAASAALNAKADTIAISHPDTNRNWGIQVVPVRTQFTWFIRPS